MELNFTKMQGAGNDYLYLDCRRTGLPLVYTVYPESCADLTNAPDAFEAKIYVKPIWEI